MKNRLCVVVGKGNPKDQEIMSMLTSEGWIVRYADISNGFESQISGLVNDFKEELFSKVVLIKGFLQSYEFLRFCFPFKEDSKRVYHLAFMNKKYRNFALLDAGVNKDMYQLSTNEIVDVVKDAITHYKTDVISLITADGENKSLISFPKIAELKEKLEQQNLKVELCSIDVALSKKSAEVKGIEFLPGNKLIVCLNLDQADMLFKALLTQGWVARGFVEGLQIPAILHSRMQNTKSIVYALKQLEQEEEKNVSNN